jgi:hypothetical protein
MITVRFRSCGPASFDRSHVLAVTYTYMLPVRRFAHPLAPGVLHGWEISGINRAQTGAPLAITGNTSVAGRHADYLGGPVWVDSDLRRPNNYINARYSRSRLTSVAATPVPESSAHRGCCCGMRRCASSSVSASTASTAFSSRPTVST